MRRGKLLIIIALLVTLAGSVAAWTRTSASLSPTITAGGTNGKAITAVTPIGEPFTIIMGKAQKISGVELYKIELGSAQFSNLLRINVILDNSYEMGKVLNSPNSFIEINVYYSDPSNSSSTILNGGVDNSTRVLKDDGEQATAIMSRAVGDVNVYPSVTGQTVLYILASITTPEGPPPGQQEQLNDIRLYINIDVRGRLV